MTRPDDADSRGDDMLPLLDAYHLMLLDRISAALLPDGYSLSLER
jgi:hypothetical protein